MKRYESVDSCTGIFGRGWTFDYESKIEAEDKELTLLWFDNHIEKFKLTENNQIVTS